MKKEFNRKQALTNAFFELRMKRDSIISWVEKGRRDIAEDILYELDGFIDCLMWTNIVSDNQYQILCSYRSCLYNYIWK